MGNSMMQLLGHGFKIAGTMAFKEAARKRNQLYWNQSWQ